MKIQLLDGVSTLSISEKQSNLMKKIINEIMVGLGVVYATSDINSMDFHIKGVGKITALVIRVQLNFTESDDVADVVRGRLSKLDIKNDGPGLSFMSLNRETNFSAILGFESNDANSEISFWYQFTPEEIVEWNGNHIYGFDMF